MKTKLLYSGIVSAVIGVTLMGKRGVGAKRP